MRGGKRSGGNRMARLTALIGLGLVALATPAAAWVFNGFLIGKHRKKLEQRMSDRAAQSGSAEAR